MSRKNAGEFKSDHNLAYENSLWAELEALRRRSSRPITVMVETAIWGYLNRLSDAQRDEWAMAAADWKTARRAGAHAAAAAVAAASAGAPARRRTQSGKRSVRR